MIPAIDGGFDPGAVGPGGLREKEVNLVVSLLLADILNGTEAKVALTHETDQIAWPKDQRGNLQARCDLANRWGADFFISIHCNSANNPAAVGTEAYTTPGQGNADPICEAILKALMAEFPDRNFRTDVSDGDLDKEANFYVLKNTKMPAVLVELAFISNPTEEQMLADPDIQQRFAAAIAQGIIKALGLKSKALELPPDGVWINARGQKIQGKLINGVSYAPVRVLAESLGHQVEWNQQSKTVTVI